MLYSCEVDRINRIYFNIVISPFIGSGTRFVSVKTVDRLTPYSSLLLSPLRAITPAVVPCQLPLASRGFNFWKISRHQNLNVLDS